MSAFLHVFDDVTKQWVQVTVSMLTAGGGGGGGGDASAANQVTQITRATEIRDRLPATPHAQPLTDAQLRASAVPVSSNQLAALIAGRAPVDTLGQPSVAWQLAVTSVTANQALTGTCRRISIRARGCPMRYAVGVGAQTADANASHFIDQDERLDLAVPAGAHIAAVAIAPWGSGAVGTGSLAITELV